MKKSLIILMLTLLSNMAIGQVIWPYGPATHNTTDLTSTDLADTLAVGNTLTLQQYTGLDTSLTVSATTDSKVRTGSWLMVTAQFSTAALPKSVFFAAPKFAPDTATATDTATIIRTLWLYDGNKFIPAANY